MDPRTPRTACSRPARRLLQLALADHAISFSVPRWVYQGRGGIPDVLQNRSHAPPSAHKQATPVLTPLAREEVLAVSPFPGLRRKDGRSGEIGLDCGRMRKRKDAGELLRLSIEFLAEYQERLAAQDSYGLLVVLQGLDAAGKDGTIWHVMSGVNPQGVVVHSFEVPSAEELNHDYLWRCAQRLPARGQIGIFNRSQYEEVLVVRVHPELLEHQRIRSSGTATGSGSGVTARSTTGSTKPRGVTRERAHLDEWVRELGRAPSYVAGSVITPPVSRSSAADTTPSWLRIGRSCASSVRVHAREY